VFIEKLNFVKWFKELFSKPMNIYNCLILLFLTSSLVIVPFLSLQSITTPPEKNSFGPSWMPFLWTFVYCTRYFVYLIVLIIILFFVAYHKLGSEMKFKLNVFKSIYLISLFWSILYWGFIQYQFYSSKGNGAGSQWFNEKENIEVFNLINSVHLSNPKTHIVYSHFESKKHEGLITNYANSYPTDDYNNIVSERFFHSKKLILILSMPNQMSEIESAFLKNHEHTVLRKFNNDKLIKIDLL